MMQDIRGKILSFYKVVERHIFEFCVIAISLFFFLFTIFGVFGLLPKDIQQSLQDKPLRVASFGLITNVANTTVATSKINKEEKAPIVYTKEGIKEAPLRVVFPSLHREVAVHNPESTDNATLDSFLLRGVVRYPSSAKLNETGNVFLLGHSSYLKIVRNKAYQAFNDIQKLRIGEQVILHGAENQYIYEVREVRMAKGSEISVDLSHTGRILTLVTCNTFGAKEDRYIVTADFVRSVAL